MENVTLSHSNTQMGQCEPGANVALAAKERMQEWEEMFMWVEQGQHLLYACRYVDKDIFSRESLVPYLPQSSVQLHACQPFTLAGSAF